MKDKQSYARTKHIVSALLQEKLSRKTFEKELAKNGISVLFRENDDKRIYGATFIDHETKAVFNGSRMGKEFSANVFHKLFNGDDKEKSQWEPFVPFSHEQDSGESLGGLLAMEQHGDNYEEIAFTNRMKRKKKKPRGPKL